MVRTGDETMSDYDVLYAIVIRLPGGNGSDIYNNIDEITEKVGKAMETEFKDIYGVPLGMELVEPDGELRIINRLNWDTDYPEEDDTYEEA